MAKERIDTNINLGDFTTTANGTPFDPGVAEEVTILIHGGGITSGNIIIEITADGTNWVAAPGTSTFNAAGVYSLTVPVKQVRARSTITGNASVRAVSR